MKSLLVTAGKLAGGQWFMWQRGRHIVVPASASRYHGLPEGKVYAVSLETGLVTALDPAVQVEPIQWGADQ